MGLQCSLVITSAPSGSLWVPESLLQLPQFTYASRSGPLPTMALSFVLLQGSSSRLQSFVHPSWFKLPVLWICSMSVSPPSTSATPPFLHTLSVSHVLHGGLLDASFVFFSTAPFLEVPSRPYSLKSLRHVLSPALKEIRGQAAPPPASPSPLVPSTVHWLPDCPGVIDWGGCFPTHCGLPHVRCKSVFSSTKWVVHPFSFAELRAIYDILQPSHPDKSKRVHINSDDLPFLNTCPICLLHHALTVWSLTAEAAPTLANSSGLQETSLPTSYPRADGLFKELEESAVAVKADDTSVPIHLWDDRLWAGSSHCNDVQRVWFTQRFGRCPLVSIRCLALRFWCRQVLRSFIQYQLAPLQGCPARPRGRP